jgi:septal ring factor EnvC (AmiA/AmiB activator)
MRNLSLAILIVSSMSSSSFALEDCNKSSNDDELTRRLECLQKNNTELSDQIKALDAALATTQKNYTELVDQTKALYAALATTQKNDSALSDQIKAQNAALVTTQKNNIELSDQIRALNAALPMTLKANQPVVVETAGYCLAGPGSPLHLSRCNYGGAPVQFSIHPPR